MGKQKPQPPTSSSSSSGPSKDKDAPLKVATSLKLRHILTEKRAKIDLALTLLAEGKAFDVVAQEYSEDKAKLGGALGWMSRQGMVGPIQDVAFKMQTSTTAKPIYNKEPIRTKFGYHVVMVREKNQLHHVQ